MNELQTHLRNSLTSLGEWKLRAVTAEVGASVSLL